MRININSTADIDYSILESNIKSFEESPVNMVSDRVLQTLTESNTLTLDEVEEIKKLITRRNRILNRSKFNSKSKAGANLNTLGECFENGLITMPERHLVRINLSTALMSIIQIISNLGPQHTEKMRVDLSDVEDYLGSIISGSCEDDSELRYVMDKLFNKDNIYLKTYIKKAFSLSLTNNILIKDAFNIQKSYNQLRPIECFSLPISNSLNHLAYAIAEGIEKKLLKTDKKFAIINNYNMYYFVKGKALPDFLNLDVVVDGIPLDIKVSTVSYKINV